MFHLKDDPLVIDDAVVIEILQFRFQDGYTEVLLNIVIGKNHRHPIQRWFRAGDTEKLQLTIK